jgi:hypothetical protein
MSRRLTGFLLALALLALAVPLTLGCCWGSPDDVAHAPPAKAGPVAAAAYRVDPVMQAAAQETSSAGQECGDHPTPAQTPYIENNANDGGRGAATSRGANAALDSSASPVVTTAVSAHRYDLAADDTGPPLWLRTCVSRT